MTKKHKFTTILCLFIVSVFAMIGAIDSLIVKAEGWTAKSGYMLSQDDDGNAEVYVNGIKIQSVDGIYTFTVNGNTTVTVKAVKKSGCKSSVGETTQLAVLLLLVATVYFICKKKTKFDV